MHRGIHRVKPLHLNLAARPYRDYKPVYAVVVVASLLVAFLMLNNVETYYRYVSETQETRAKIADLDRRAAVEQQRAQAADAQLRGVNLVALDSETRFINARLAERAFSWSELLDHLETALPANVRITSVAPRFGDTGVVQLALNCEGKSPDAMLNAINRFQRDPHFANPFPTSQQENATGFVFGINVDYKPDVPRLVSK